MVPSEEQVAILQAVLTKLGSIKINAYAGSGKTSSMKLVVEGNPTKRFLYLAFNKAVAKEAKDKFPDNCSVYTVHGLAYRSFVPTLKNKAGFNRKLLTKWKLKDYIKYFKLKELEEYLPPSEDFYYVCHAVKGLVNSFKYSDLPEISPEHYEASAKTSSRYPKDLVQKMFEKAREIWEAEIDMNSKVPLDHGTYLKLWELTDPKIKGFDFILFDEAQDANPVMLSIIDKQDHVRKIFCGDNWQAIYGFTNAVNAMSCMDTEHTLYLTQSWRFGDAVASEANRILKILSPSNKPLRGNPAIQSTVGQLDESQPHTIIFRTNGALALKAIELINSGKQIYVEGGVSELCDDLLALYYLSVGERSTSPSRYRPFYTFGEVFEESKVDITIRRDLAFVQRFKDETPALLDLLESSVLTSRNQSKADVILTTAHKAKGLEWHQVKLHDDFRFAVLEAPENGLHADGQELNLLYVSVTRAQHVLELNEPYRLFIQTLEELALQKITP